ncbi:ABC transporter permease [Streptacidiphilus jiangxiensis]|uniref:ABC-2 type transport system permease protein n=1 Tax=Streptacidiphilus jiangxiensis TaxID=235985 RepID=A0A1H7HM92_STRJI|nr:ABC transporter permease [Streptacidiphilus jiangxiensis]SEK51523.1 ABC-2 type transport system permease protein [Streptacidiphilus jiangxiensis]
MTTTVDAPTAAPGAGAAGPRRPVPLGNIVWFELVKQFSAWRVRLLILLCWLGPGLLVFGIGQQATLPSDTLFGRWMHTTGWAGSLVVLGWAGTWALPLVTSVVAGDVFASEDRLGTWRHVLVAVRSHRRIFAAKAVASVTVIALLVAGLVVSGVVGGLLAEGNQPLIGLGGQQLSGSEAGNAVLLAWLCVLAPTLALAAIGLLGSVALGRSPMGLLLPMLAALGMQVAQMLPLPVAVRLALPGYAFISWNGLFAAPQQLGPLLIGVAVSLLWAVVATALAYLLFLRRDFTNLNNDGAGRRMLTMGVLPLAGLLAATAGVVALTTDSSGSGITQAKVQRSVAAVFAQLYPYQQMEIHQPAVTAAQLQTTAVCSKNEGLGAQAGPGNDWRCTVNWIVPGTGVPTQAVYQLNVTANGRYSADGDGPVQVNGYFVIIANGKATPNPLWQFDGNVDLLPGR